MMPTPAFSAPGKIILSGEHAVVFGYPALIAAIDLRTQVVATQRTKLPTIRERQKLIQQWMQSELPDPRALLAQFHLDSPSSIPRGKGLGSSASLSVALSAFMLHGIDAIKNMPTINELAYRFEQFFHGSPSGGDNTASFLGGLVWYRKESENFKVFQPVPVPAELPSFFLVDSGTPSESTKDMVAITRERFAQKKKNTEAIFHSIEAISRQWLQEITLGEKGNFAELIDENQKYLEQLGVVSESAKSLVKKLRKFGASAKITGAGGKTTGSGMLLVFHKNRDAFFANMQRNNIQSYLVRIEPFGFREEIQGTMHHI